MDGLTDLVVKAERKAAEHRLVVHSQDDADVQCACGDWSMVATGYRSMQHIEEEFQRHLLAVSGSLVSAPVPQLPTIAQVMSDPTASRWLRLALRDALDRDCVDAVNDAELLLALLKARNEQIAQSFGQNVRF